MDLEQILNEALNDAMCNTNRIKNPNSNKVAQFVNDFLARKELKSDFLHSVICTTVVCEGLTWGVSYKVLADLHDMYVVEDDDNQPLLVGKSVFQYLQITVV